MEQCRLPCSEGKDSKKPRRFKRTAGGLKKYFGSSQRYFAKITFDQIMLHAGEADLPTTLEFLVILTSIKHKMHFCTRRTFEERLQDAVASSAQEHGRNSEELGLRFAVCLQSSFFLGLPVLKSPTVRSLDDLKKLRSCIAPFRDGIRTWGGGRTSLIWHYGLVELEERWQLLQDAVKNMWEGVGMDSTRPLEKLRGWYASNSAKRNKHLEFWELQHMAVNDKNEHRPQRLRAKREYKKRRSADKMASDRVIAVRRLLQRWKKLLQKKAQRLESQRLKLLRQRKKQRQEQKRQAKLAKRKAKTQRHKAQ